MMWARVGGAELWERAVTLIAEHRDRGCGQYGGTEGYERTAGGRWKLTRRPCLCTCPDHPCTEDRAPTWICEACHDAGAVGSGVHDPGAPGFGRSQPCPVCCEGAARSFEYAKSMTGFPPEYLDEYRIDNLDPGSLVRGAVSAWVHDTRRPHTLTLSGPAGVGKTHAALAAVREFIRRGEYAYVALVPDLIERLRATNRPGAAETADEVLRMAFGVALLVLDDFGAERATEYATEQLFRVIDRRQRERRATIITTNTDPDAVTRSRLTSRIFGDAGARVVVIRDRDHRMGE